MNKMYGNTCGNPSGSCSFSESEARSCRGNACCRISRPSPCSSGSSETDLARSVRRVHPVTIVKPKQRKPCDSSPSATSAYCSYTSPSTEDSTKTSSDKCSSSTSSSTCDKSSSSDSSKSCGKFCAKDSYSLKGKSLNNSCPSSGTESDSSCTWSDVANSPLPCDDSSSDSSAKSKCPSSDSSSSCSDSSSSSCGKSSSSSCDKSSSSSCGQSSSSSCDKCSSSSSSCDKCSSSSSSSCKDKSSSCYTSSTDGSCSSTGTSSSSKDNWSPEIKKILNGKYKAKFVVTLEERKGHPWAHRICDTAYCMAIDGHKGQVLHLHRGQTYLFDIRRDVTRQHPHRFYFTTDPAGGPVGDMSDPFHDSVKLAGTAEPAADGFVVLKVTDKMPQFFYYQSRDHKFCGGMVVVHK